MTDPAPYQSPQASDSTGFRLLRYLKCLVKIFDRLIDIALLQIQVSKIEEAGTLRLSVRSLEMEHF